MPGLCTASQKKPALLICRSRVNVCDEAGRDAARGGGGSGGRGGGGRRKASAELLVTKEGELSIPPALLLHSGSRGSKGWVHSPACFLNSILANRWVLVMWL